MFGLLLALAGFVLMQAIVRTIFRFGLPRVQRDIPAGGVTAAESRRNAPTSDEVLFEIGLILALHLAFAIAVIVTVGAYGVS